MADFIKVLYSGSKGNSTLICFNEHYYLIDIGVSFRKFKNNINEEIMESLSVLITHDHSDHTKGLKQLLKHNNCDVYGSSSLKNTYEETIVVNDKVTINDIEVEPIFLSHDCVNTMGYILYLGDYKVAIVSDTGYLSDVNLNKLYDSDVLLLEANHDVNMLMGGKYSWQLKNRIVGDYGHLSNYQFNSYCKNLITDRTKYVVAIHLSEENNDAKIVMDILEQLKVENKYVADQERGANIIYLNWR